VAEWEGEIQGEDSRSALLEGFTACCQSRIAAFEAVGHVQITCSTTQLKLNRWMNARSSEQRLTPRAERMFGKPSDKLLAGGDGEQRQHRRNKDPRKGKRMQDDGEREAGGQEEKEESPSPQERGPASPSAAQPGPEPALRLPVLFSHLPNTYDISRTRLPG
jgi:hypothetical protein